RLGIEIVGHQRPPTRDAGALRGFPAPAFSSLVECRSKPCVVMALALLPRGIVSTSGRFGSGETYVCLRQVAGIGTSAGTATGRKPSGDITMEPPSRGTESETTLGAGR